MHNTYITHISKQMTGNVVYLFEYTEYHSSNDSTYKLERCLQKYSPIIPLGRHMYLLYKLKNEAKLLEEIQKTKQNLHLDTYSLICIEQGYIASSWLKKI